MMPRAPPKPDPRRRALELRLGAAAARCGEQRFVAMRESPLVGKSGGAEGCDATASVIRQVPWRRTRSRRRRNSARQY
jgi:hypothetical protein